MASALPIPSTGEPIFDPRTGVMSEVWRRYFLSLESLAPDIPPIDAKYWVSTANSELTDDTNIGALATGYLKITTGAGVAVPSSVAAIPGTDVTGAALSRTNDTNVTLTLGGSPTTGLLRAISLTLGWTGILSLARGGTNADLSATGGASRVLRQSSAGASVTVSQLDTTDISGLVFGAYTPTLTNGANVTASTAYPGQYLRVGNVVTVSGRVDVEATAAAATATALGISLPVASNFANSEECTGTINAGAILQAGSIFADVANDRASVTFTAQTTANTAMAFIFQYRVLA